MTILCRRAALAAALVLACQAGAAAKRKATSEVKTVRMEGYVGMRYADCLERRVKTENVDTLISVFRLQDEERAEWGSEFWGKWVQGAIGMYRNTRDGRLREMIQDAQTRLIACQLPSGYIGDYDTEHQLTGWDVWGRKYTLLGLVKWYRETGSSESLSAACRLLDYTMSQIGPGKTGIVRCGLYKGMPPASILEPVMFMYGETGDERYLQFARYIVDECEGPEGPQLIARADVPVARRWPVGAASEWWSESNGQKAYEMMSCYIGMLELYRVTGEERLLRAAQTAWRHIAAEEINVCGSGASYECWYGGAERQHRVAMHTMETCVTFTWMQFCERLLEFTGDPVYADHIERTMYNALMASMKADASQIEKYTPLEGYRHEGEHQCGLPINCCNANGPRAFAMIPRVQYRLPSEGRIDVNLYIPSRAELTLGGRDVVLVQETDYPKEGDVALTVTPDRQASFALALRIPSWSADNTVEVNGTRVDGVRSGEYCVISRMWKPGDRVTLRTSLKARLLRMGDMQAIVRGPVVLARDSRFRDGYVDESCIIEASADGTVALEPVAAPSGVWMAFRTKMLRGAYSESEADKEMTYFCDFASAGNTWDPHERYRVWLPRTLNVQTERE